MQFIDMLQQMEASKVVAATPSSIDRKTKVSWITDFESEEKFDVQPGECMEINGTCNMGSVLGEWNMRYHLVFSSLFDVVIHRPSQLLTNFYVFRKTFLYDFSTFSW